MAKPKGSIAATVGEKDFAVAMWKAPLFPDDMAHAEILKDEELAKGGRAGQCEPYAITADQEGRYVISVLATDQIYRIDTHNLPCLYPYKDLDFHGAYHLAKLSNGNTVVSCMLEHKIKIVEEDPESRVYPRMVKEWGGLGSDLVSLCYPHGVCVDGQDNVYVADTGNFRVMKYDKEGIYQCCPVAETWNHALDVKPTNVAVTKDGSNLLVMMQGDRYESVHVYRVREEEPVCCDCGPESCWANCWEICIGTYREPEYEPIS